MSSSSNNTRRSSLMDHHHHHHHHAQHYNYPSFSSSLLEEIYRSFDEDHDRDLHLLNDNNYNNSSSSSSKKLRTNKSCCTCRTYMESENGDGGGERSRVNRSVLDKWMENEKKITNHRRTSSMAPLINSSSSTSSSSDSSSGICGFSSSDSESLYRLSTSKSKSKSNSEVLTLKPIKTTVIQSETHRKSYSDEIPAKKTRSSNNRSSKEGNLHKRALKLYGDLKKVKQPISPGGKLASFLNSLFNSNASKKPKISSSSSSSHGAKLSASTPSTASSSYSRSCLSKTPSSAGRFERRSVRFCPVNTVIAVEKAEIEEREDWREKTTRSNEKLKVQIMEKHRRVEEVAKELLKNYQHGRKFHQINDVNNNNNNNNNNKTKNNDNFRHFDVEDEDEDEDDNGSCCSSDLFELENLLEIGSDRRYREELPVYETTHVDKNRAIANRFIL